MSMTVELTCTLHPQYLAIQEPSPKKVCACFYIWSVAHGMCRPSMDMVERQYLRLHVINVRLVQRVAAWVTTA
jgi:hypothetical protein